MTPTPAQRDERSDYEQWRFSAEGICAMSSLGNFSAWQARATIAESELAEVRDALVTSESLLSKIAKRLEEDDILGDYDAELEQAYSLISKLIHLNRAQPAVANNTGSSDMAPLLRSQGRAVSLGSEGAATPGEAPSADDICAWKTFDGEGGYDLRLYEDNEDYRDKWIATNGDKYADWVEPLYGAELITERDELRAELERVKLDAQRYQVFRSTPSFGTSFGAASTPEQIDKLCDAAIDAARGVEG